MAMYAERGRPFASRLSIGLVACIAVFAINHGCFAEESEKPSADVKEDLPDYLKLWSFQDPGGTEKKFRELLPVAEESGDRGYHAELLTQIARAQGLQRNFEEAHDTLDEAKALLTDETPEAKVRYLLERGRVFNSSGAPDRGKPLFIEAWDAAREAGEGSLAVDAAHMVAIAEQGNPKESLRWNELALKYVEESEDERTKRWLAPLYNNTGWAYHDQGEYGKAMEVFEKALEFHRQSGDEEAIHVARWTVARCLRSLEKFEEALGVQKELEGELVEKGKADGFVFEELAENNLALGNADEAKRYFALAYRELSKDEWFKANEPGRLERCRKRGGVGE